MPRERLPIDEVLPQLLEALRGSSAAVLRAPTGAGKTTRVPPALLDAGLSGGKAVVMLEPRRIAARAAARRIAFERGTELGGEVGYHVRFERKASRGTRILVVTEGLLVRMLQDDPFLSDFGAVVFDEFHERSLHTDLALALVRRVQQDARPELRIVVMSATIATAPVAEWLGGAPVVESEGRLFPVAIEYAQDEDDRPLPAVVGGATLRAFSASSGDVLAFLPGVGEIRRTREELEARAGRLGARVLELYGDLPAEQQDEVLRPSGQRKIVLATNVAETSVTIAGVTAVVDSGLARVSRYDPGVGLDRLELERISRASADQRAGRAGRTQPGTCLRLWTERAQRSLRAEEEPEIRRVDLAGPVLQLFSFGERDPFAFPWFEAPPRAALERGLELLRELGAFEGGGLSATGRALARLPVHPRIGRLLLEGARTGVLEEAALAGALVGERDPFLRRPGARAASRHRSDSDTWDRILALEEFERNGSGSSLVGELNRGAAAFVLRARDALLRAAERQTGARAAGPGDELAFRRALLAAYPDRVVRRRAGEPQRGVLVGGRGVRLADESAVHEGELYVAVEIDAGRAGERAEAFVRQASRIEREWLPQELLQSSVETGFDAQSGKVLGWKRTRYVDLVLDEVQANVSEEDAARELARAAAQDLPRALGLAREEVAAYLARVRSLAAWMPEAGLPALDEAQLAAWLPEICAGRRSFEELQRSDLVGFLRGKLGWKLAQLVETEAPERLGVPSGSQIRLEYEPGKPPVLAVRIQEVFGLADTPRVAGGRVRVLLHLLAPNYRPQQVTDDLRSFWSKAYFEVRKDLRARYPKHAWPEDPWNAPPQRKGGRRNA
jgi:ATP-dependent helicase HrpB